jgi:hypothetical protein
MALRIVGQAVGIETKDFATYMTPGTADMFNGASYYIVDRPQALEMMRTIYLMKAEADAAAAAEGADSSASEE